MYICWNPCDFCLIQTFPNAQGLPSLVTRKLTGTCGSPRSGFMGLSTLWFILKWRTNKHLSLHLLSKCIYNAIFKVVFMIVVVHIFISVHSNQVDDLHVQGCLPSLSIKINSSKWCDYLHPYGLPSKRRECGYVLISILSLTLLSCPRLSLLCEIIVK